MRRFFVFFVFFALFIDLLTDQVRFLGVLKGLAGCIVKPTAGAMDMVTHTFQGIKGTAGALDG